ncbi:YceD family protein [Anaerophaga thermohalophila]|uniref:YceD family protein n=1 Tax=Anaerophaga thermohalophila TaxID=177400 RepID=UPI000237D387|nr:DUF177 domain-containing protein [Anaerophaga thermohalophila]
MAAEKEKKIGEYGIAFKGLKEGEHLYEYKLGSAFFELFEQSQVETGELLATVTLTKSTRMLELSFHIEGVVEALCDRCLGLMEVPVTYQGKLFIKFGEAYDEPTEEIVILPQEEHTINIARFMYEYIVVSIPIRHVHSDKEDGTSGCDPEMLARLETYLVDQEPSAGEDGENDDEIDPRWNELKKLKNKNNK